MPELRPYQREAVESVYDYLRHKDGNPCVVIPTAGGKSWCLAQIAADAVGRWGGRVMVLAHVRELLEQNADKIARLCPGIPVGVYSAGLDRREADAPIVVGGIQSVYDKATLFGRRDLLIVDEAHLVPPDGEGRYRTFLEAMRRINPLTRLIGFTATPYRLDGGAICRPENLLNDVCYEARIKPLIAQGYLSPITSEAGHSSISLGGLNTTRGGELAQEEVDAAVDNASAIDSACRDAVRQAAGRKSVIVFCSSVKHAEHVAKKLRELTGDGTAVVTGETGPCERAEILRRFKGVPEHDIFGVPAKPIRWLCNVSVLTTGFDAPNIDCVVLLRPTNSAGLYVQMAGRGLRLSPETGKEDCLVLDYAGCIFRHGPLDMVAVREPGHGPKREGPLAKECPNCREMVHPAIMRCPRCGYEWARRERSDISGTASRLGILSGDHEDEVVPVHSVSYARHVRRDARPEDRPTVRVTYEVDLLHRYSEWLCVEHTGYPRAKFCDWWRRRSGGGEPPDTVAEALELAEGGRLLVPESITVRRTAGEPYPRIVGYRFKPQEECDDDLPF